MSSSFIALRCLRHGSVMSPIVFVVFVEWFLGLALKWICVVVVLVGFCLSDHCYEHHIVMMAGSIRDAKRTVDPGPGLLLRVLLGLNRGIKAGIVRVVVLIGTW